MDRKQQSARDFMYSFGTQSFAADADSSYTTPLLSHERDVESVSQEGGLQQTSELKAIPEATLEEKILGTMVALALMSSMALLVVEGTDNATISTAAVLSSFLAPYAWYQQKKLTEIKAMKETHNNVKVELENLEYTNGRLRTKTEGLSQSVDRLSEFEDALNLLAQVQGHSIDALKEQIEENRSVLDQMQKNVQATVLQNVISIIRKSDEDGSLYIEEDEVDTLIERVSQLQGVQINKKKFIDAITENGGSIQSVMTAVKSSLFDDTDDGMVEYDSGNDSEEHEEDYEHDDDEYEEDSDHDHDEYEEDSDHEEYHDD